MTSGGSEKRRRAYRRGFRAEHLAAASLLLKGYRLVAMRYKTRVGEIDIIARKGNLACFIEVKARKTVQEAVDAVSFTARKRIESAADLWLGRQHDAHLLSMRFDIIAVCPWRWPVHFRDAF